MNISREKWLTLSSCMVGLAALMLQACTEVKETDCSKLCGNWVSVGRKPDVLIYREGDTYKKPETYLLRQEEVNLFINTGYRIDIAYNEEADVLTFSPHGDYVRAEMDAKPE